MLGMERTIQNIKLGSNPSTVKEKLGDGCAVKIRILQQHHNSSNIASVFRSQTILLGFLQGNERHIIKKTQICMCVCLLCPNHRKYNSAQNKYSSYPYMGKVYKQMSSENKIINSTRQVCILKLKVRNNQCLQIVPHVTGTVASTRGIKIKKQSCL